MRCKYDRVLSIIHRQLDREPEEDKGIHCPFQGLSAWSNNYFDMTPIEKSKLMDELFSLRKANQELIESECKRLGDLLESFQMANVELRALCV